MKEITKSPEFNTPDELMGAKIMLQGGKVGAIPESIYRDIQTNINNFLKEKKPEKNQLETIEIDAKTTAEVQIAKLQEELGDIDEALEATNDDDPIKEKIIAYRKKVENKIAKLNETIANTIQEEEKEKKLQTKKNELMEHIKHLKGDEEKIAQNITEINKLEGEIEKINHELNLPNPSVTRTVISTKDEEKANEQKHEKIAKKLDKKENKNVKKEEVENTTPAPLYSVPDTPMKKTDQPLAKEEAELNAYRNEKTFILQKLEQYKDIDSRKNKEKRELLQKLADIEKIITELQEKITTGELTYPEKEKTTSSFSTETKKFENQQMLQNSDVSPEEETYYDNIDEEKKINEQIDKLKAIDTPNARSKVTDLEMQLANLTTKSTENLEQASSTPATFSTEKETLDFDDELPKSTYETTEDDMIDFDDNFYYDSDRSNVRNKQKILQKNNKPSKLFSPDNKEKDDLTSPSSTKNEMNKNDNYHAAQRKEKIKTQLEQLKQINTPTALAEIKALEKNLKELNIDFDFDKVSLMGKEYILKELAHIEQLLQDALTNISNLSKAIETEILEKKDTDDEKEHVA